MLLELLIHAVKPIDCLFNRPHALRSFEKSLLHEFKANLSSDLQDIEFNIEYLKDIKNSNSIIARFLDYEFEYNDSLDSHFGRLSNAAIFMADVSTYESSKSVGLTIIRNDELRRKISHLYSGRYRTIQQFEQSIYNTNSNGLMPAMFENLKDYKPLISATPTDIDQIRESVELQAYIRIHIISIDFLIDIYDSTREEIVKIFELIDQELE